MKRKTLLWVIAASLILGITGGYFYIGIRGRDATSQEDQAASPTIQQSIARMGSITISASGVGTLIPASQTELSFPEKGKLVELNVAVGQVVEAGQVLARLQTDKTAAEYQSELTSAQLAVVRAQQALNNLYKDAALERAQAQVALEDAEWALEEVNSSALSQAQAHQALVEAKETLQEAQMRLEILNSTPSQQEVEIARASLLFKEKNLQEIQDQVSKLEHELKIAPTSDIRERLRSQLLNLQVKLAQQRIAVEDARYKVNSMSEAADPIELTATQAQLDTAQAQLAQAQRDWETAQAEPAASSIALAESDLAQAQAAWQRLKDGPDPDEVSLTQAQLEKAQAKLAQVQQEKLVLDLMAPIDGTVISISCAPGDRIANQVVMTLANLASPVIQVNLDETHLDKVQVGYPVKVNFDAMPEKTFNGEIVTVDPSLVDVRGSSVVQALVQLDVLPSALFAKMPIGLTASVEIIAGEADQAILVPVEAVKEINPGEYGVYVVAGENLQLRQVSIGLRDFTSVQILDGLAAGETVALGEIGDQAGLP
ncbi:MAG: HlyD family efflux transporter periplasmic adaptor subunit [Anaerolineales bacterium]